MAYTRSTDVNSGEAGDSILQAVLDVDTDLTRIFANLNTHEALTNVHGLTESRRVYSVASSATPTFSCDDYDAVSITALAADITSMTTGLTGTPVNFQKLLFRFKDDGTPRAIAWGAKFAPKGVALPTTTYASKLTTVGFIYDTVAASWGCVAVQREA